MTKTITQLQPFIYETLLAQPKRRQERRTRTIRLMRRFAPILYVLAGLRVTADTGFAPWEWGFWAILVPLYILGEWTIRELSRWLVPMHS